MVPTEVEGEGGDEVEGERELGVRHSYSNFVIPDDAEGTAPPMDNDDEEDIPEAGI